MWNTGATDAIDEEWPRSSPVVASIRSVSGAALLALLTGAL